MVRALVGVVVFCTSAVLLGADPAPPAKTPAQAKEEERQIAIVKRMIEENTGEPKSIEWIRFEKSWEEYGWARAQRPADGLVFPLVAKYRAKNNFGAMQAFTDIYLFTKDGRYVGEASSFAVTELQRTSEAKALWDGLLAPVKPVNPPKKK